MFSAARDLGAYCNDSTVRVSSVSRPQDAVLCVNGLNSITKYRFSGNLLT